MRYLCAFVFFLSFSFAFTQGSIPAELKIDSTYGFLQFYDSSLAKKLVSHFDNIQQDKFVIFHYGGSHIQAERPTSVARKKLQQDFGNGGHGMIFNYGAADTYSSVNYTSTYKGVWKFAKSFQTSPKIPLGVCGMAVEANAVGAELNFKFKNPLPQQSYKISLFTDVDSSLFDFKLRIDSTEFDYHFSKDEHNQSVVVFEYQGMINSLQIKLVDGNATATKFPFYGMNIEKTENSGIVYHSLGVGAAPFKSVLQLEKMPTQAKVLKPDLVFLDFGTNDILYSNAIDPKLSKQIIKAIASFREVNPEVIVVLTSVQDLYYKGKYITVGPAFRDLIDSIAQEEKCMFWNWYDLSGGLGTIRTWMDKGYAQSDCIHLTDKGYEIKGNWIYQSILNTIERCKNDSLDQLTIPPKQYEIPKLVPEKVEEKTTPPKPQYLSYKVKQGDTLSEIAERYHTGISKIKSINGLKSDTIRIGQILKIPK